MTIFQRQVWPMQRLSTILCERFLDRDKAKLCDKTTDKPDESRGKRLTLTTLQ